MKTPAMKPIIYDRRQVALMVEVATLLDPEFRKLADEGEWICLLKYCEAKPKRAALKFLDLHRVRRGGYVWNPR